VSSFTFHLFHTPPSRTMTAPRVRFAPSPTGYLHVGGARTALFNWLYARHTGGTLVLRIEDTDLARNTVEGYRSIIDSLKWLGIDWDEGPEVGGDNGPYRQSERFPIYAEVAQALRDEKAAYDCYCTTDEVEARRKASGSKNQGYDGFCRDLDPDQLAVWQAEGRMPVLRFRMPSEPIVFDDLVRGEVTFLPENVPDFAVLRANGDPLYTLTNPLDDAMMGITHVLRGEDLLSSTPRQIPIYQTLHRLGVGNGPPRFGHLPMVMGEGNRKLSKRDPGSGLLDYVDRGFLPEGLLNYLALLGWGIAEDRDVFTMQEMAEAFDVRRVNPSPARFDMKKLEAINSAHMRRISLPDMTERVIPFLAEAALVDEPIGQDQRTLLDAAMPLVHERINTLSEAVPMLGFLFVDEDAFRRTDEIDEAGHAVVQASYDALSGLDDWSTAAIEASLREALVEGMGLKPRNAFGPVRVAVTGSRVSPPLFESLELLGRERSLGRLQAALA
jgi:glutamyl-tRNA synthetase